MQFHIRQRTRDPGRIPQRVPAELTRMPDPDSHERRMAITEPVLSADGVTRGLGLESGADLDIQREVTLGLKLPELDMRRHLAQLLTYKKLDPALRSVVLQRAVLYHRAKGEDHNNEATRQRRVQGLRKGEDMDNRFHIDLDILSKAAGSRGGVIVGYTASGKPIYQSSQQKPSGAASDSFEAMTSSQHKLAELKHKAAAEALVKKPSYGPAGMATDRGGVQDSGRAKLSHHREQQRKHAAAFRTKNIEEHKKLSAAGYSPSTMSTAAKDEALSKLMSKAMARGGTYHARVTDKATGKHRYYYDEDKYASRPDAHLSGKGVLKSKCKGELAGCVGKGAAVKDVVKKLSKYDEDVVKDAIRSAVKGGTLLYRNGKLIPPEAAKNIGADTK